MKKKVMLIFGTRPEAIKMCPVVNELKRITEIETIVCVTGQHREMLDQVLDIFEIEPDYNLKIMKNKQDLFDITMNILDKIKAVLIEEKPDLVIVHGDTSSTFVSSLACFYLKIPVAHIEAGLRTYDLMSPFPEEFNRQVTGIIAKYHFAPTNEAKENLLKEGKENDYIYITGNTVIDALKTTVIANYESELTSWAGSDRLVLLTAHRRENLGTPMINIFSAVNRVVNEYSDVKVIFPIHMNPQIREIASKYLLNTEKIRIIDSLDVLNFHNLMAKAYIILTDSGGIQEEAPSLSKPVLVLRDTTERPEGVNAGTLKMVGTEEADVYEGFRLLLDDIGVYEKMSKSSNPYGDGNAAKRIVNIIADSIFNLSINDK